MIVTKSRAHLPVKKATVYTRPVEKLSTTPPERLLTTPEVCALAGCTYRQADYWTRQGVIGPARQTTARDGTRSELRPGSGSIRGWTIEQAAKIRLCTVLTALGAQGHTVVKVLAAIDETPELWSGTVVITPAGKIVPIGIAYGMDGWMVDLAGCRSHVGAPAVGWPATA